MKIQAIATAFSAIALTACAQAQDSDQDLRSELDRSIPDFLEKYDVPAVSIAIVDSTGKTFAAAYGEERPGEPATPATLFNVASVAKLVTAETVLRLASGGEIDIDQPMAPTWIDPDLAGDPIVETLTPRHALAHQTGFPNWRSELEDGKLGFQFDPGTRPGYSGEGYNYVARFMERRTDASFPEIVARQIDLDPDRDQFAFNSQSRWSENFAWSQDAEGEFKPADVSETWSAADDFYVTPTTMAKLVAELLVGASLSTELETDRRTIQFEMTDQFCGQPDLSPVCPNALGFGLSGVVFQYENETVFWQGGGDVGERTIVFFIPKRDLGVVIFTNGANGAKLFAPIAELVYDNTKFIDFLRIQGDRG